MSALPLDRACGAQGGLSDERGIALAVALFVLAVIGALVGGTFFAGRLELQSGQNALWAAQAGEVAEGGLSDAVAILDAGTLEGLAVGGAPLDIGTLTLAGGVSASRQVTRLTDNLFLIRVRGVRHGSAGTILAVRSLGLLIRLAAPSDSVPDSGKVARLSQRAWVQLY